MSSTSRARTRPVLAQPTGVLIGLGSVVVVVSTMVAAAIPVAVAGWRFAVVAVAVGGFAALTRDRLALAWAGALAWLLVNGFLVDRFGELSWHGRADLYRALMLGVAAAVGRVAGVVAGLSHIDEEGTRDA